MLEHLNSSFRLANKTAPNLGELARLQQELGPLNFELEELLREVGVAEFVAPPGQYFRTWDAADVRKSTLSYRLNSWLPPVVAFGDDGGDHIILQTPAGVFRADTGALDSNDLHFLATSLAAFLAAPERLWLFPSARTRLR